MVGHVGGGDLEALDAVVLEDIDGRLVPWGAEDVDVAFAAVVEDFRHLLGGERVLAQEVEGVLGVEVLPTGGCAGLAVESVHVAQLELHQVRTGVHSKVDEFLRECDVTLVVVADLGDDQRRIILGDAVATEHEFVPAFHRDTDDAALLVEDGDVGDGAFEEAVDLARGGVLSNRDSTLVGDLTDRR